MSYELPYEWRVGWRYMRAGRAARGNRFISFISGVSMISIALGVAVLIIVLSVMNGFQKEVRDRMLSVIAHVEVFDGDGLGIPDWRALAREVERQPQVVAAAPFAQTAVLLVNGNKMAGVQIRGIDPAEEPKVTPIAAQLKPEILHALRPGGWGVILGRDLARELEVRVGGYVTVITPSGDSTPLGVMPRLKRVQVVGIFFAGHYVYDSQMGLMHLSDVQKLQRMEYPPGLQLKLKDSKDAREVGDALRKQLSHQYLVSDWTRTNEAWFAAVRLEKVMMLIILTLIVAVAAFNLVSTLVMTVTDKRADIAILRTLGATPRSIMSLFMIQGSLAGIAGTVGGVGLGLLISYNIGHIVELIEKLIGRQLIPSSVYLISNVPSDVQAADVAIIAVISLILAFVATLYPSARAARVQPAEALRYE